MDDLIAAADALVSYIDGTAGPLYARLMLDAGLDPEASVVLVSLTRLVNEYRTALRSTARTRRSESR